ncbi:MAG: hypothetical protein GF370_03360 [Candidatus Nealsonbacteria bacterium]|nr:hypothetical protein [Candidatus Nealsonbacteria bacterium]
MSKPRERKESSFGAPEGDKEEEMRKAKAKALEEAMKKRFNKPGRPSDQDKELKAILTRVKKKLDKPSGEEKE